VTGVYGFELHGCLLHAELLSGSQQGGLFVSLAHCVSHGLLQVGDFSQHLVLGFLAQVQMRRVLTEHRRSSAGSSFTD
jgi:hypothetical protein